MATKPLRLAAALLAVGLGAPLVTPASAATPTAAQSLSPDYRTRAAEDEVVYFLLPDRFANGDPRNDTGGLRGDRLATGFDPTSKAFYNGGDLKGVLDHLDYIQGLGATAIWLAPVFKNKPVQGEPGQESAGYHGYWITDFTDIDPHFGTRAEFKALVDAAHARGMKVYMDIVANHTADIIRYKECPKNDCAYRSKADFPASRRGGVAGEAINPGFGGEEVETAENFAKLTRPDYAYTPYVPPQEAHAKVPDWLNDPIYYHNRGNSTYRGESATFGDFAGLDDLMTENPKVVQGFIDIYGAWIDAYHVDGFRIDTVKHVNEGFWRVFVPAILARAKADGVPNFHIFGEVFDPDPAVLAHWTKAAGLPAVLDFGFQAAVRDVVAEGKPPSRFEHLFAADVDFAEGEAGARRLPTFLSNHDMGRFALFIRRAQPKASDDDILRRLILAEAMSFFLRGQPVIYYGDEQGFVGRGGDQEARQSMFASQVAAYNQQALIGTSATTTSDSYHPDHPLYRAIRTLADVRAAHVALRRGSQQILAAAETPGLFALWRESGGESALVVFNTADAPISARIAIPYSVTHLDSALGACPSVADAPGSVFVTVPPLGYLVCTSSAKSP